MNLSYKNFVKLIILALVLLANSLSAQPVKSLGDLNRIKNYQSPIFGQVQSGNKIFFAKTTDANGREPWVTDGTPEGTMLLKDIVPGAESSDPELFSAAKFGGTYGVYFTAYTPATGRELWISDGTPAGTKMIQDLRPGPQSAFEDTSPTDNTMITSPEDSFIYFAANNGATGVEPFFSNGVVNDILLVFNFGAGADSSDPRDFKYLEGNIFFSAEVSGAGRELVSIPLALEDINPGAGSSEPNNFFVVGGSILLYTADDGITGRELRKSDGGSVLVKDTNPGAQGSLFTIFNQLNPNSVVFSTIFMSENPAIKLWKSDGTSVGTLPIKELDCVPGGLYSILATDSSLETSRVLNGKLIFPCSEVNFGSFGFGETEPWVSDGTIEGTKRLKNIAKGKGSSDIFSFNRVDNKLLFFANDNRRGFEPWVTDGTEEGTRILKDFNKGEASSGDFVSILTGLFKGNDHSNKILLPLTIKNNRKVFITDGNIENTKELFDNSASNANGDSYPEYFVGIGKKVLFAATSGNKGSELFETKGKRKNTKLVKNIYRGGDSAPYDIVKLNKSQVVFSAITPTKGRELWVSDGTKVGTKLVKDINKGNFGSDIAIFNNKLRKKVFFSATNAANGKELWITNGKRRGTKLVKDIYSGVFSSNPQDLVILKNKAIFGADSDSGREVWISNGKTSGTLMLKDIYAGADSSNPSNFIRIKDKVLFSAYTPAIGVELYITDGTEAGTMLLKDINPGAGSSSPSTLTVSGDYVYFIGNTALNGRELWRTDGTEAGTIMIQDFTPGVPNTSFGEISSIGNNQVIVSINNPTFGRELHIASPTPNSINLVKDINVGASDSSPERLYKIPNKNLVYFSAYHPTTGRELYRTDGTNAGTVLVQDINVGVENSSPEGFYFYKRKLYFSARTEAKGKEPYFISVN